MRWASELYKALKEHYTGATKLKMIQDAMARVHHDPRHEKKPVTHPARHLSAVKAVDVLIAGGLITGGKWTAEGLLDLEARATAVAAGEFMELGAPAGETTIEKARQLIATGEYNPPKLSHPADDIPPPPDAEPEAEQPKEELVKPAAGRQRKKPLPDQPGVKDMSAADIDTVGPRDIKDIPPPLA